MADEATVTAPLGTEPAGDSTPSTPEAPKPIELSDDTLILDKATGKPVKYGEYNRGFQSQFTRAAQERARLQRELETERAQRQRYEQERQRAASQGNQNGQRDVFADLRSLPFLSGEQTVQAVESIINQINQRDQFTRVIVEKMVEMEKRLGGLSGHHNEQLFDSKINKWVTDAGYDPKAEGILDLAKEIYLAYEGPDLDAEFPTIFTNRMKQIEAFVEAKRRQAVQAAKRPPFVPGKGGQANPSRPVQLKPNATPKEVADALFGSWNESDT